MRGVEEPQAERSRLEAAFRWRGLGETWAANLADVDRTIQRAAWGASRRDVARDLWACADGGSRSAAA